MLQSSAQGFLQGLYPPAETTQTLRNGTVVSAPFGGYQIIPINLVSSGTGSEDNGWLQDASGCQNAQISSNNYFLSQDYMDKLNATRPFYQDLVPVVNRTFAANYTTFKNAYTSKSEYPRLHRDRQFMSLFYPSEVETVSRSRVP